MEEKIQSVQYRVVCKRKYEGAELRYGRPKPAAANANSLAHEGAEAKRPQYPLSPCPAASAAPSALKRSECIVARGLCSTKPTLRQV